MKVATAIATLATLAAAQRPSNTSICDYYTTALLKTNNATTQQTLLTLVVNTAVIGNYTQPNVGIKVPGILTPGTYNGTQVNLAPYFNGMLASTNQGGSSGVSQSFLNGGGATPLMNNMPANDTSSAQYTLLTHLYQYFAVLLGCSQFGSSVNPYAGRTSMYDVHKFMALDVNQMGYFITQVGMSAASFGVAEADVMAVGTALENAFDMRCAAPAAIPSTASASLQAICIASNCPMATASADCSAYAAVVTPMAANGTSSSGSTTTTSGSMSSGTGSSGSGESSGSGSSSAASPSQTKNAANIAVAGSGVMAAAFGAAVALL